MSESKIKQDPKNARLHSEVNKEQINKSLKDLGAGRSVVIDNEDYLIAGNGVYEQAEKLGLKTKVIESDGTELVVIKRTDLNYEDEKRRKLAIADNATSESSEWNFEELTDDEIEEWGIEEHQEEEIQLEAKEDDFVEEVSEIPISVLGDLYEIGEHRLLCGDSTDSDAVARLMDGDNCSLCFTSPPYNLGKSVGLRNGAFKGKDNAYSDYDDDMKDADYVNLLKDFHSLSMTVSEVQAINIQSLAGNKVAILEWLHFYKNNFVDVLIWNKTNPAPAMAEKVVSSAFEFIYIFDKEQNPKRSIRTASFKRGQLSNVYTSSVGNNSHTEGKHGATFPIDLASHYISNLSKSKDNIYEPFCGSGTTMVAAHQLKRKCYGMELDPKYCDVIVKRMLNLDSKLTIKRNSIDCTEHFKTT